MKAKTGPISASFYRSRIDVLLDELDLSFQWDRPSLLFVIYASQVVRRQVAASLSARLARRGKRVARLEITPDEFDVPLRLLTQDSAEDTVFFISGLGHGGGRADANAFRALNIRRELLVEHRIRAVFWVNEPEALLLPQRAADFWAFRHRVVEFLEAPLVTCLTRQPDGFFRAEWEAEALRIESGRRIGQRASLLQALPANEDAMPRAVLLHGLAALHWSVGALPEAESLLQRGLETAVHLPAALAADFHMGLGLIAMDWRQWSQAADHFQAAARLDARSVLPLINLSALHARTALFEQARSASLAAVERDPGLAAGWVNLGMACLRLGRPGEALDALRKAARRDRSDAHLRVSLGEVCGLLGQIQSARRAYRAALRLAPGLPEAEAGLAALDQGTRSLVRQ